MSLKKFHLLFIATSIGMSVSTAFFTLRLYASSQRELDLGLGLIFSLLTLALIVYVVFYVMKMDRSSQLGQPKAKQVPHS
jgi:ABC-type sugar transport system permease subunit